MSYNLNPSQMTFGTGSSLYTNKSMNITKFIVQETGTYNQQWMRPFVSSMNASTYNSIVDRALSKKTITPGLLSGVANQFMHQKATPEKHIIIPNGWGERRLRFFMEVQIISQMGVSTIEYIYGYSDHLGMSMNGHIDHNMPFIINGINHARVTTVNTGWGNSEVRNLFESSQIIANTDGQYSGVRSQNQKYIMRPEEMLNTMDLASVLVQDDLKDAFDTSTTLTNSCVKTDRKNNIAPVYVSNMLESYLHSVDGRSIHSLTDRQGILQDAVTTVQSSSVNEDAFMSKLRSITGSRGNTFTYKDLIAIDPNVQNVTFVSSLTPEKRATLHQVGFTEDWGTTTMETLLASTISQAVPGYMLDQCINKVHFKVTNRAAGGMITMIIMQVKSLMSNVDITPNVQAFEFKIKNELFNDITYDNSLDFSADVSCDLNGETWINISVNGGPDVPYVLPSFCDSLMSPVVTIDYNNCVNLASDFRRIIDDISDNRQVMDYSQMGSGAGFFNQAIDNSTPIGYGQQPSIYTQSPSNFQF